MSKKKKNEITEDQTAVQGLNLEFDDSDVDADEPHVLSLSEDEDAPEDITEDELEDDVNIETEIEAAADSDSAPPLETDDADLFGEAGSEELAADAEGAGDDVSDDVGAEQIAADQDTGDGELEGTELEAFESAEIEDVEVLAPEQIRSIVESSLFATDKPISIASIKQVFKGTQVKSKDVRQALTELQAEYQTSARGFTLEEIAGGFQLRTKPEHMKYLRQSVKARPFKLSGPALEVLSIVAYKQPTTKNQIDEIRGVESGHLLRALMEKHLLAFGERSDLPGKPMFYETTKKFLEIFSLRNLAELPSLSEIDQLIPEGIGEVEDKETLSDLTGQLSKEAGASYSEGEDELLKITDELTQITTSSDFFEQEKQRERERRDAERARDLREALTVGEAIEAKDQRWLDRYEQAQVDATAASDEVDFVTNEDEAAQAGPANASSAEAAPIEETETTVASAAYPEPDLPPEREPEVEA